MQVAELLTDIGLEVEGMEEVESIKGGLKGVVVGEVVECEPHPNADKLSLTKVDVGKGEPLQVVCGAPNVRAGQKVLVATPGTVLYDSEGSPFKIKRTKLRGAVSEGMICAEDELGIGTDHSGIMVLPADTRVGMEAAEYLGLVTDVVFEIGLTPNRADGNSHIGTAKDLAAKLTYMHGRRYVVRWPDYRAFDRMQQPPRPAPIDVEIRNTDACPRYAGLYISGVKIGPSPDWIRQRLESIGVRSINNVVDITNFVLHEMGQPLHAFDADKITGSKVIVDTLPEGTPFVTLDEKERRLRAQDLMICNAEVKPMCIAGVFGGLDTGVTEMTTNIFLESAYFEPDYIRPTSFKHDLRTDAARCFEKGVDINRVLPALKRAALLLHEYAGADINYQIVDVYPRKKEPAVIRFDYDRARRLIGAAISNEEMDRIMEAMDFELIDRAGETVSVRITTDKPDVTRQADLVEEILRIYGYNTVPIPDKVSATPAFGRYPGPYQVQEIVAGHLAATGFLEAMSLSITRSTYFDEVLPVPEDQLVFINNTSNVNLNVMRPSMVPGLLEAIARSQNRQVIDLMYFEFGKTYHRTPEGFAEPKHLSLAVTGKAVPSNWLMPVQDFSFHWLRSVVENVLKRLGITRYAEEELRTELYAGGLRFVQGPRVIVEFGLLSRRLTRAFDIRSQVFFADFNWDLLLQMAGGGVRYRALNKFPTVRRDLALLLDQGVSFGQLAAIARRVLKDKLAAFNLFDVYENEAQLGAGKKSYAVSLVLQDTSKTLKDQEVDAMIDRLVSAYRKEAGAELR